MIIATAVLAGSCSDSIEPPCGSGTVTGDGDNLAVDMSLSVTDMGDVESRAFSDNPDYANLHVYVVEFDDKGSPLDGNTLTNIYIPEDETLNEDGDIHFTLELKKTIEPRVLHLIAVPKGVELDIPYGLEGSVIPSLQVADGNEAYWQRVEFPDGYGTISADGKWTNAPDLATKLTHVPMIRNFAKIEMKSNAADFTLEGFEVYNLAGKGSVAPWNSTTMEFPAFTKADGITPLAYSAMQYAGVFPGGEIQNRSDAANGMPEYSKNAKHLYERPATSIRNTMIVFKGKRKGDTRSSYYKIDLGNYDDQSIFRYYNVLRNFKYTINITEVGTLGYETVQEAIAGVVYNNFSFDVNTRQMLNISDGNNMLWVNQTTFVVNDPANTTVRFRYRYRKDITGGNTLANDAVRFPGLEKGEAISNIEFHDTNDADGWREVTITTSSPTSSRKMQEFIVYDPETGLGRTISIIVRDPWKYTDIELWGGNYNTRQQYVDAKDYHSGWNGYVYSGNDGAGVTGAAMTVIFTIEDNIPEAMFPLTFTVESRQQNIENNKIGTLNVISGDSFFFPGKRVIKYVKIVTWADYNTELSDDNFTGTLVDDDAGTGKLHRIRCRLLTIGNVAEGENLDIRVYNPYMTTGTGDIYADLHAKGKRSDSEPPYWEKGATVCPSESQH